MTTEEKQIIEIKECIDNVYGVDCAYYNVDGFAIAHEIYQAGYCRRVEGEWVERVETLTWCEDDVDVYYDCSVCGCHSPCQTPYCPNCGAKMKGSESL